MSHRDSCPPSWKARRQGEDAAGYGQGSYMNPYDRECREAARAWEDGHRMAERQAEEELEERRHQAMQREHERIRREEWEQAERDAYEQRRYEESLEEEPIDGEET